MKLSFDQLEAKLVALTKLSYHERAQLWEPIFAREGALGADAWEGFPNLDSESNEAAMSLFEERAQYGDIASAHETWLDNFNIKRGSPEDFKLAAMLQRVFEVIDAIGAQTVFPEIVDPGEKTAGQRLLAAHDDAREVKDLFEATKRAVQKVMAITGSTAELEAQCKVAFRYMDRAADKAALVYAAGVAAYKDKVAMVDAMIDANAASEMVKTVAEARDEIFYNAYYKRHEEVLRALIAPLYKTIPNASLDAIIEHKIAQVTGRSMG